MDFDNETHEFFEALISILSQKPKPQVKPRKTQVRTILPKRPLEMPEVLQSIIQDYARPLTRGDWRTCKRNESQAIYLLHRDKRHVAADFIGGPEFWDIVVAQTFYELLKNYPPGPPSDEGQTTIQLRRVWA
jgi:hypothetical protein